MSHTKAIALPLIAAVSVPAWAATADVVVAPVVASVAVSVACLAAAVKMWLERRTLKSQLADLEARYAQSERTVSALQTARQEHERIVAQKNQALGEIESQRQQAHDMLATLRQQVERVARIDGQTGVANHQQFLESLDEEIKRTVRQRKPLTLLYAELDFFTDYVDINGRERGDYVLQNVASCVSDTFRRAGDLVARVGSCKFAVVLPEADQTTGERFAEKLRRRVYDMCVPFPGSDAADRITVSVGAVTVPPKRLHDRDYVIAMAENALMHAQASGHNQVCLSAHAA